MLPNLYHSKLKTHGASLKTHLNQRKRMSRWDDSTVGNVNISHPQGSPTMVAGESTENLRGFGSKHGLTSNKKLVAPLLLETTETVRKWRETSGWHTVYQCVQYYILYMYILYPFCDDRCNARPAILAWPYWIRIHKSALGCPAWSASEKINLGRPGSKLMEQEKGEFTMKTGDCTGDTDYNLGIYYILCRDMAFHLGV